MAHLRCTETSSSKISIKPNGKSEVKNVLWIVSRKTLKFALRMCFISKMRISYLVQVEHGFFYGLMFTSTNLFAFTLNDRCRSIKFSKKFVAGNCRTFVASFSLVVFICIYHAPFPYGVNNNNNEHPVCVKPFQVAINRAIKIGDIPFITWIIVIENCRHFSFLLHAYFLAKRPRWDILSTSKLPPTTDICGNGQLAVKYQYKMH